LTIPCAGVAESLTITKERNNGKVWLEDGSLRDAITSAGSIHNLSHDFFIENWMPFPSESGKGDGHRHQVFCMKIKKGAPI
jgi:hypothetical protein